MITQVRRQGVLALVLAVLLMLSTGLTAQAAESDKTYTVTANLYCPGELNTQLPGVTAYLTNGNNPLGIDGYEAVAPTTPVSDNATLTVGADGTLTLSLKVPNPVFTLQKIGGCSNATIVSAPRDDREYATTDGSVSRSGRITGLTLTLSDTTGKYIFTDCTEFPTLLGVDWTVPLTLEVDLSGVDLTPSQSEQEETAAPTSPPSTEPSVPPTQPPTTAVNLDALNSIIATAERSANTAIVSVDGNDVEPGKVWVTQADLDTLKTELAKAKAALAAADQSTVDAAVQALTDAHRTFTASQQSGKKVTEASETDTTLAEGTYTVSCNIWFNKADTGLPLNPHITNPTFPPYNPVLDNAALTVDAEGNGKVTIPVTISDKVMTVRSLTGLSFTDVETTEEGAITSVSVELGRISTESTVITQLCTAEIQMGDLAMSISGLEKDHTWPAVFELNLSDIPTSDGGKMPVVEVEMMNAADASQAMASAGVSGETDPASEETPVPPEMPLPEESSPEQSAPVFPIGAIAAAVAVVALVAVIVVGKKKLRK